MKIVFTAFIQIVLWIFCQVKAKKEKLLITNEKKNYEKRIKRKSNRMTEKQRKLLFLLAKQKGMDNEILHSYVEAKTGKQSITEVTTQEAKVLLDGLQEKKQTAKGHITEKQLHYMKGLAKNLGWNEKTLNQFIEKQYGISNVHWLSSKQAAKVIEGLKSIQEKDKKTK